MLESRYGGARKSGNAWDGYNLGYVGAPSHDGMTIAKSLSGAERVLKGSPESVTTEHWGSRHGRAENVLGRDGPLFAPNGMEHPHRRLDRRPRHSVMRVHLRVPHTFFDYSSLAPLYHLSRTECLPH